MRQHMDGFGLGEKLGNYAVTGVSGALAQGARRFIGMLCIAMLVALVVIRPSAALTKGAVTASVVLVLSGLALIWRRTTARFDMSRCHLYTGGLVVTNVFGRVRAAVPWSEVTGLKRLSTQSLFMALHRVELERHGSAPLALVILGVQPALMEALVSEAIKNEIR